MIGRKLADRYEIVSELGRGGMGVVYRARDPRLNRDVAVKVIPPAQLSEESETRFEREAQLVAQMDHPSIVPIYDFGRHEDALYFVMALVQGTNLRAFLAESPPLGDVVTVGIQVAEALEYSHARGVVHRDIKPENIMVAREEGLRVRVMDFGLARATAGSRLTRTGTFMGTLAYLSPEQIVGSDLDGRSDVYALGTVLYESLVGEPPFTGEPQAVVYRIVHEFPQSLRARGAVIDEGLESLILACLAKDPSRRPQRAGELAESLKRYRLGLRDTERARPVADFTRTLQMAKPAFASFVGRQRETAELQQRLNAAVAGECQFVVIGGEAGIGKTRLLDELENLARARQIRVLHGRAIEQDRALPYQGFFEIFLDYFRLKEHGSAPRPDFSDLAQDLVTLFPMLAEVPEIRSAMSGPTPAERRGTGGPESRTQIFELLARTLTRIAAGRPLVLSLEDLHSAEVSLEALAYIVRRLGPAPILIVGTYRSTEISAKHPLSRMLEDFHGERRCAAMVLGPLSPTEHRAFLETLVEPRIADPLVKRLYEGTEGNPFFTKELVRSLIDAGGIVKDDSGAWNLSAEAGLAAEALPATIQKAVEQRVGRLPEDLRDILAVAAVIGKSFDARDLAALVQARDVDDAIDRLVEQGLIEEERESRGGLLSFSSGVVRDVLYAGLSPRKRRSLHRRCAELIESRHAGRLERVLPQLVTHFFQGDVPEKTVEYAVRLTRTALEAFSVEEAIRSATTALTFLDEEWEGPRVVEGETRLLLARARRMSGDTEGALREAAAAVRIFEREGHPAGSVAALLLAAETAWQARQPIETGRWVERGLAAARTAADTESLRVFLSLAATLANLSGEYRPRQHIPRAVRAARRRDAGDRTGRAHPVGGPAHRGAGEPGQCDRARLDENHRGIGDCGQHLRDAPRDGPGGPAHHGVVREMGNGRRRLHVRPDIAPRRALLRRHIAHGEQRQAVLRDLDPLGSRDAPARLHGRAGRRRVPDGRDRRGHWRRRARRERGRDPPARVATDLPVAAHRGQHGGGPAGRGKPAGAASARGHRPVRARVAGPGSRRARTQPQRTGAAACRVSTASSSGRACRRPQWCGGSVRVSWISPATCCPRIWRRSCVTRASGRGSSKHPRRTRTSCCSTVTAGRTRGTRPCGARWLASCARATWCGARWDGSPSRRHR